MKQAIASRSDELHTAGVIALCNWPDPSASDDLLVLAKGAGDANPSQPGRLRALIRIHTTQPPDRPTMERLASLSALKKAMDLTTRDQERKALLEGIGFVRTLETLHYVLPYLDDKELNQAACRAVVELAHSKNLREPNKKEFDKALERVLALCKDKGLLERAKQYKQGS